MQDVDICNMAISMCAADPIASIGEVTPMGQFCATQYPQKRAFLLGIYRWVFATKTQPLSRIDESGLQQDRKPAPCAFVKPTDILGVVHSFRDQAEIRGARPVSIIENDGKYWSEQSAVWAEYTANVDEGSWPSWFVELVKVAFASDVARRLQNNSLAASFQAQAFGTPGEDGEGGLFMQARTADTRAAPQRRVFGFDDGVLVNVRVDGGYGGGCWDGTSYVDFA